MTTEIRVRFAPSPTGYLHVGGARTALFNYLFARHFSGKFILRIEDTDQKRFQKNAMEEIFESLKWLGLLWDEGPDIKGDYSPYIQSERIDLYKKYAQYLLNEEKAYRCFCTSERLAKVREEQQKQKMQYGSGYDRHCRNLSKREVKLLMKDKNPYVIRLKIPENRTIIFNDLIRGNIEYSSEVLDDIVLLKSDSFPTYHLANIVDDHLMKISHVLRGDEWIASTPKHILLYESFGWKPPQFAHMPVILAPGGGKLSKRRDAASVMDFKKAGYLPETLFNFLALLGWAPGDDRELMTKDEIINTFSLEKISAKASIFDEKKLEWMNGFYMRKRSVNSIKKDVISIWQKMGFIEKKGFEDSYYNSIIKLLKDRSKKITELAENAAYFFIDPKEYETKASKKHFKGEVLYVLETLTKKFETLELFNQNSIEKIYRNFAESSELSVGKLIHPTRLAISGISYGPGLFELIETLGKERVVRRMKAAIKWIETKN